MSNAETQPTGVKELAEFVAVERMEEPESRADLQQEGERHDRT